MGSLLTEARLKSHIKETCEELAKLDAREHEINASSSLSDLVEKDNLLRRLRAERRTLRKSLQEFSLQKALVHYSINEDSDDSDEAIDDAEDNQANIDADIQDLDVAKTGEFNRLINLCIRTKSYIKAKRTKT